jgi:lipid II:glycine glycyltransferase (peptidoglycan interpeptide bridge formation enzyme)
MGDINGLQLRQKPDLEGWNDIIRVLPDAHLLQTREWASVKAPLGWFPLAFTWEDAAGNCEAACLILKRQVRILPGLLSASILYAPKGPLVDWHNQPLVERILLDLEQITRSEKAIFIKIDPDITCATGMPGTDDEITNPQAIGIQGLLNSSGWHFSYDQVQFRNTITINLASTDAELLEKMKQKTRYNIRLAERKGVIIRKGSVTDAPLLSKMYMETALRNNFTVRDREYYERVWDILSVAGMLTFLIAEVEEEAIAGLVLFHFAGRAYYFYGMSTEHHRDYMPTYLLQWKAIQVARELGCTDYDLWGAPDDFNESDAMWGVFRFKEGLGGRVIRTIGAWDFPARPGLYHLYTSIMPRIQAMMRLRGRQRTTQEINS